jgi:putative FmdB family regulatory protein
MLLKESDVPTYVYKCEGCSQEYEFFHAMSTTKRKCPGCRKNKLKKQIGAGGGVIFKGEPFSASTEYRAKDSKKP